MTLYSELGHGSIYFPVPSKEDWDWKCPGWIRARVLWGCGRNSRFLLEDTFKQNQAPASKEGGMERLLCRQSINSACQVGCRLSPSYLTERTGEIRSQERPWSHRYLDWGQGLGNMVCLMPAYISLSCHHAPSVLGPPPAEDYPG